MDFAETAGAIALGFLFGCVSSLLAVWLALKKFRTEKWWERKAEAYAQIMKALYTVADTAKPVLADHRVSPGTKGGLTIEVGLAIRALDKAVAGGKLFLSAAATCVLERLVADVDASWDSVFREERCQTPEGLEARALFARIHAAVEECLNDLPAIAKRDLLVPGCQSLAAALAHLCHAIASSRLVSPRRCGKGSACQ